VSVADSALRQGLRAQPDRLFEKLLSDKKERFQFCRQEPLNYVPAFFEEPRFGYRRRTWSRFDNADAQRRERLVQPPSTSEQRQTRST
jgi:hypothetical protein